MCACAKRHLDTLLQATHKGNTPDLLPDAYFEVAARNRNTGVALQRKARSYQRDFEHSEAIGVPNQSIREPRRPWVHRARNRDAERLKTAPTEILHRRRHPGPVDDERTHDRISADEARRLKRSASIGTNLTRSPGRKAGLRSPAGSNSRPGVRPTICHPPGLSIG